MDNPQRVVFQSKQLYEGMGFALDKPIFMLCTLGVYLLIIFKIGPNYMKNRAAYNLKTFMVFYNISQVLACVYILYSIFDVTSLKIFQFWKCDLNIRHINATEAYNSITMFTFWLKIVELTETVVFVLRKKQKQVSKLHVFHHCSTITLVFSMSKYYKGLSALYPLVLNSFVHIMMYSYYLAAAVCDKKVIEKLTPLKKSITIIQMIQFVLILVQACIMYYACDIPRVLACYYGAVILVIFYGFYDFYQKSYIAAQNRKNRIS